jgi:YgiT-type zinc finger domain-containing protein
MIRRNVTYALEIEGRLFVVENVPASVCEETEEQYSHPRRRNVCGN